MKSKEKKIVVASKIVGWLASLTRQQTAGLAVVALVSVAFSGSYLVSQASSRGEGEIKLSNNKKVTIGQSRANIVHLLGASLHPIDGAQYNYLSTSGSVEAVLIVLEDRLVAVRVIENNANSQPTTGASVGAGIPTLRAKIGAPLRPLPAGKVLTSLYGYSWATPTTTSFYFTNPCHDDGLIVSWVVADKGNEAFAVGQVKKLSC